MPVPQRIAENVLRLPADEDGAKVERIGLPNDRAQPADQFARAEIVRMQLLDANSARKKLDPLGAGRAVEGGAMGERRSFHGSYCGGPVVTQTIVRPCQKVITLTSEIIPTGLPLDEGATTYG